MRVYYKGTENSPMNAAEMHASIILLEHGSLPPDAEISRSDLSQLTGLTLRRLESDIKLSKNEESKVLKFIEKGK